jgi:proteasome accessory factor A
MQPASEPHRIVEKILGADFELANSLVVDGRAAEVDEAVSRLLAEVPGFPQRALKDTAIERGRRFLSSNGSSAYEDSGHFEWNCSEHATAWEHPLHIHAGLRVARRARQLAEAHAPPGSRLSLIANNCDGLVSYGSHVNLLTTQSCLKDLCGRKPHLACFLATHLVTSVLYTGQGMVGAANGRPACAFQLSQRADWFEQLWSEGTMHKRPLINQRNESHASAELARLHCIFYDMVLAPAANRLRAGTLQAVVAMCEAGVIDPTVILEDPVAAAAEISRDLSLGQRLPTIVRGRPMTSLEIQRSLWNQVAECHQRGMLAGAVPGLERILADWKHVLDLLQTRDVEGLAPYCDNWLKYFLLQRLRGRRGIGWNADQLKVLDLQYGNLDPEQGLFFQMAADGVVADMPSERELERFVNDPPSDTRAYLRAHVLRQFGNAVSNMDWSWIDFCVPARRGWFSIARLQMPDPRRHGEADCADAFAQATSLEHLLDRVPSIETKTPTRPRTSSRHEFSFSPNHFPR